jgi:hypothetical protein
MIKKKPRLVVLPEPVIPPATHPCKCKGCYNKVPFEGMVCVECFLVCTKAHKSDGHRHRKLTRRRLK